MSALRRRALVTIAALWIVYAVLSVIAAQRSTLTLCAFGSCGDPISQPFDWSLLFVRLTAATIVAGVLVALVVLWLRPTNGAAK